MINSKRLLVDSVRRYCERRHIELLSHSHDWILQLRTPRCSHLIYGYDLGANSATAAKVANDKSATYDVLAANGIRAIEHRVFLHPRLLDFVASEGNWRAMLHAFEAFGRNAVIKDNEGTGGMEVFRVRTVKELEQQVHGLFQRLEPGARLGPDQPVPHRRLGQGDGVVVLFVPLPPAVEDAEDDGTRAVVGGSLLGHGLNI